MERQRDTDGQGDTHTDRDRGGQRGRGQKNEKGTGLQRTPEPKSETQGGNTETGPEREKGGRLRGTQDSEWRPRQSGQTERAAEETPAPASSPPPPSQAVDPPGGQEQDATDGQIGKKHEEPHSRRERVQEGKVAGLAALVGEGVSAESPPPAPLKALGPTGPTVAGKVQPAAPASLGPQCHPRPIPSRVSRATIPYAHGRGC